MFSFGKISPLLLLLVSSFQHSTDLDLDRDLDTAAVAVDPQDKTKDEVQVR